MVSMVMTWKVKHGKEGEEKKGTGRDCSVIQSVDSLEVGVDDCVCVYVDGVVGVDVDGDVGVNGGVGGCWLLGGVGERRRSRRRKSRNSTLQSKKNVKRLCRCVKQSRVLSE